MALENIRDDQQSLGIPILGTYFQRTIVFVSLFPPPVNIALNTGEAKMRWRDETRKATGSIDTPPVREVGNKALSDRLIC